MRILLLLRAAPGAGKSTLVENYGLKPYTLSADEIRLQYKSLSLKPDGGLCVSQEHDNIVWATLFEMLEERMKHGEFTVIDATNSKTSEMKRYKDVADKYRYRIYLLDMTDVPINVCKLRNSNRQPEWKRVPDSVIDKMYARFATQTVPSGIKVIKNISEMFYKPFNANDMGYKKVLMVGDIHGSYTPLKELLGITSYETAQEELDPETLYIFLGDYLDRGAEIRETVLLLKNIYHLSNVILLEGNHEGCLRDYANDFTSKFTREFSQTTQPILDKMILDGEITKKDLTKICRKFGQICEFWFDGRLFFVSHGGIPSYETNLIKISTEQLVRGVGQYEDTPKLYETWNKKTLNNQYQVHGHRNSFEHPIHAEGRCYNLEGAVERGGYLRAVLLSHDSNEIKTIEIKNTVENKQPVEIKAKPKTVSSPLEALRSNPFVKEKAMGNISSFNFTRKAFQKKQWDDQTIKARGLFMDTRDGSVFMRGYEKFFNVNEVNQTRMVNLKEHLEFPIMAYVKENGFLGLISYDKNKDELCFATKSVLDSYGDENDYVIIFKDNFYNEVQERHLELKEYLKRNDVTIACECVDPFKDPHIIEYSKPTVFILDIIENSLTFKKRDYNEVLILASKIGLQAKELAFSFNTWKEFYTWYLDVTREDYTYNGKHIEGFVLEDSSGFMFKLKLDFYNTWKQMRGLTETVLKRNHYPYTGSLDTPVKNYYYKWIKERRDEFIYKDENGHTKYRPFNIIKLRNQFFEEHKDLKIETYW